ncbi:hypothetical protein AVEN_44670-1 [Araneus ventricosus]|uniref:Reverse transcriptase RNase H-like domain-containing protein n=1 Tax=Araneus ventricosus TaxID=182803 RepID=A0A4Y2QX40_ARAVE|nr:hypothetical protein AVEN_44670-1 [Araneus ventricosus]
MTRTIPGPIPSSPNFSTTSMIGRLTIDSFVDQITLGSHILRFLDGIRKPQGHIARWIQRLQEYDFEIQHRKGTSHGNADALSQRLCKESSEHCTNAAKKFGMETDMFVKVLTTENPWSSSEIQKAQL